MEKRSSHHSVHELNYHMIIVTKYRRAVITDEISDFLSEVFSSIGKRYGISVTEFNHDSDHIHVLFSASPTTDLVKFVNSFKSASSRVVKTKFPEVKTKLWEEAFWSRSYYLATTGGVTLDVLKRYVQSQGAEE